MNAGTRKEVGWGWASGATALLIAVGGMLYKVNDLSAKVDELRLQGSPVMKARADVTDVVVSALQKQHDQLAQEVRANLVEIKGMLSEMQKELRKP